MLQFAHNFTRKAMRKRSRPEALHSRERALVEVPHGPPAEEHFQAQTQRGMAASRGGVETARYKRRGLLGPAEKQIGWHYGERPSS